MILRLCPTPEPCAPDWVIWLENYQLHLIVLFAIIIFVVNWILTRPIRKRGFHYLGDEYLENLEHQGD